MEIISPINQRWLLCILASFTGCTILVLFLNYGHDDGVTLSALGDLAIPPPEDLASEHFSKSEKMELLKPSNVSDEQGKINQTEGKCDIFDGRWVYDAKTYPIYEASRCPFLSDQVSCLKNGRRDLNYERWRWEARECEIPRFNGMDLLKRLRGKRVIIVGDSLNRNQWESLACLLYTAVPSSRAEVKTGSGVYKIFRAKDYNCSVEFYWSPFLVQLDENQANGHRVLNLDKLSVSARRWRGADVMLFNTGHWWVHRGKSRAWDSFQHKGKLVEKLEVEAAFRMAMKTWARWVDQNVDPSRTTVFFRSISPEHKGVKQWCYNQTQPIMDESYVQSFPRPVIKIVEGIIKDMRTPVTYLNITRLSQYRKDAHPTVYTAKQGKLLTKEQRLQPESYADCSHWCLPGLPDTWNVLLFASIVLETSKDIL
ncbi:hypothetical protein HHK36_003573 [Tetracentron sinense]|uniref:Trichome birefringence-like N-terminal domain-containing protein n=1 Tax=Tetracentron sinense TaxID=13715 RepID=A0A835DSA6_TETSI|nr:hypothetical protein HHK36_003573 [Tetracentron sinense]